MISLLFDKYWKFKCLSQTYLINMLSMMKSKLFFPKSNPYYKWVYEKMVKWINRAQSTRNWQFLNFGFYLLILSSSHLLIVKMIQPKALVINDLLKIFLPNFWQYQSLTDTPIFVKQLSSYKLGQKGYIFYGIDVWKSLSYHSFFSIQF